MHNQKPNVSLLLAIQSGLHIKIEADKTSFFALGIMCITQCKSIFKRAHSLFSWKGPLKEYHTFSCEFWKRKGKEDHNYTFFTVSSDNTVPIETRIIMCLPLTVL